VTHNPIFELAPLCESPPAHYATAVQIPRGFTLMMMAAMFGGLLVPLFMPKQAEPIVPASWIADVPRPQAIPGQPAASTLADHPEAPVRATLPPSAP
jgi:hypothetical protein